MSRCGKNKHSRTRRRPPFKGVHSVARQVDKIARFDAHRPPVYLEVERSLDHIVSLVPVVPMWRWPMTDGNLLLHQRPSSIGVFRVAEKPKWHAENVDRVALAGFDGDTRHCRSSL